MKKNVFPTFPATIPHGPCSWMLERSLALG